MRHQRCLISKDVDLKDAFAHGYGDPMWRKALPGDVQLLYVSYKKRSADDNVSLKIVTGQVTGVACVLKDAFLREVKTILRSSKVL